MRQLLEAGVHFGHQTQRWDPRMGEFIYGDRNGIHDLARSESRQPLLFLSFGATCLQRPGQDLRSGDQRPGGSERGPAEFFGSDDHAVEVGLAAGGEPAVLLGNRQTEQPHFGQPADERFRDVVVRPVDVFCLGNHPVFGEATEGFLHKVELWVEVARAVLERHVRQQLRVSPRCDKLGCAGQRVWLDPPQLLSPPALRPELGDHVSDEHAGHSGFKVALGPVVDHRAGGFK